MTNPEVNGDVAAKPVRRKSRRGRQVMLLVLIVLILLLGGISFFLVRLAMPAGKIATDTRDTKGLEWVRSIYGWGRGKSQQLVGPGSVAIGPDGTIWTTNSAGTAILGFNPDGSLRSTIQGPASQKLVAPTDIAIDPAGNLVVAENTLSRVDVLSPNGQLLRALKVQTPTAVAASADRIVVGSVGGFAIFDKEGNVVKVVGKNGFEDGEFDRVNGLTIGSDGKIYVADSYNNRISAYDRLGNRLWIVTTGNPANKSSIKNSTSPKPITAPAGLQLPLQMTFDGNNRLIVVDPFDFSLTALNPANGKLIAKYGTFGSEDGKMMYPSGVGYDLSRDWFVVADTTNNRLQVFRMPGSAPDSAAKYLGRLLAGPIRACLFPLALLILALIAAGVNRLLRRNRRKVAEPASEQVA